MRLTKFSVLFFTLASACTQSQTSEGAATGVTHTTADDDAQNANTSAAHSTAAPAWPLCQQTGTILTGGTNPKTCALSKKADVNVTIDAARGPTRFSKPLALTSALFSMGIDDRTRGDYMPTLSPTFVTYLKALHPGYLRFPAGYNGQHYTWGTADNNFTMTPALLDAFIALCRAVGAEPFLAVNIETGSLEDAINMLTYVNKTKGYHVQWWQIGNEPNLTGTYPAESVAKYTATYLKFRSAMLAVDSNLKFVALESYTGEDLNDNPHEPNWFNPFLAGIQKGEADAIAFHYYPLTSASSYAYPTSSIVPSVAHLLQEDATDWPPSALNYPNKAIPYLRQGMASKMPEGQIWVDEFAEDSGSVLNGVGYSDVMLGALWSADSMGRFIDQGTDALFHFIFKAVSADATFGYTLLDANNVPRPEYFTYWLLANKYGDQAVSATSDVVGDVAVHAAIRAADCSLRVMLINKSTLAKQVNVTLSGFAPVTAESYSLAGTSYQSRDVVLNGASLSSIDVSRGESAVAPVVAAPCTTNAITVPPYTVLVLNYQK